VGKPNEREREILLFSFRKIHNSSKITISSQEKSTYNTLKQSQNLPRNPCQIRTAVRPVLYLEIHANSQLYGLFRTAQKQQTKSLKSASKIMPKTASIFVPTFTCMYGLYGSVQYGLPQQKNDPAMKQISSLGFVPTFSWEMCPQCCPKFPLSSLLENLSQSPLDVSCTLPNAFFYKSENDIFPPKCLFTFPNPKSKGQD
jgi:hypothetical protein